jgi:BON domain
MNRADKSVYHSDRARWERLQEQLDQKFEKLLYPEDDPTILSDDPESFISCIHPDEELEKTLKNFLHSHPNLKSQDLTLSVHFGVVHLTGSVPSQSDRDLAVEICHLVHGVLRVESEIIVKLNPGILPTDVGRQVP